MKTITIIFTITLLSGCASFRYKAGFRQGFKAYDYGLKTGKVKKGYATGYVHGWTHNKNMQELQKQIKDIKEKIRGLEEYKRTLPDGEKLDIIIEDKS